ncbi:MAG: metal ABC transporter ATP-binding protein [Thermoleophilaceae bacterium]
MRLLGWPLGTAQATAAQATAAAARAPTNDRAATPAIVTRELSVAYGARKALSGVSISVPAGSLVGVLGPNGAGKTTLLRALLGVVRHEGRVEVAGTSAYVPQLGAVESSFPVDVLGVVLMGRYRQLGWLRRPGRDDRALALELLGRVGLAERARSPFASLSGGQRQRALVARALAQEGDVLLLDEPLTGIDAPSQTTILEVLAEQRRQGRTVCMTTHDLAQAARVCDRLVILNQRLVAEGPTAEVFRPDVLQRAYQTELLTLDGGHALLDPGAHPHAHHEP